MPRLKIQRLSELRQKPEIAADIILFSDDDWSNPILVTDLGRVPAEMHAMLGLTGMVIGIKTAFAAFFFGIFDIAHMRRARPYG